MDPKDYISNIGTVTKLPVRQCLACNSDLNRATCVGEDAAPKEGDLTICIFCGYLMAYNEELGFKKLSAEEDIIFSKHPYVISVRKDLSKIKKH